MGLYRAANHAPSEGGRLSGDYSRPFDVHRWSDHPELRSCLDMLVVSLEAVENRSRHRSKDAIKKFRDAVRCIILDLYVGWQTDPELLIGISLGKRHFRHESRYDALFLSYQQFTAAFRGLRALGYIDVVFEGFNDPRTGESRSTRVRATRELISLMRDKAGLTLPKIDRRCGEHKKEIIILKDKTKARIDYVDTDLTRAMRSDLGRINGLLQSIWIDIDLPNDELDALNRRMVGDIEIKERTPIDFTHRQLHRVFNNRSWDDGGRFYGGWWQVIPKEFRQHITINGKATVEVDFSGMHVEMLYSMVGTRLEGDAYSIPGLTADRNLVKRTFNKLLNAEGRMRVDQEFDASVIGMTWRQFLGRIRDHHQPIQHYLGSGPINKDGSVIHSLH